MNRTEALQRLPETTVVADERDQLWQVEGRQMKRGGQFVGMTKFAEEHRRITIIADPSGQRTGDVI